MRHAVMPSTQFVLETSYPLPSRLVRVRPSASVRVSLSVRRPTYPLCELGVHHEVVDVFFGPRELQLSRDHGNEERRTAGALKREGEKKMTLEREGREGLTRRGSERVRQSWLPRFGGDVTSCIVGPDSRVERIYSLYPPKVL